MRRRDQIERAGNEANTAFTLEPREARRVRADVFELAQFAAETDDAAQLAECLPLITYTAEDEASLSRSGGRTLAARDWAPAA